MKKLPALWLCLWFAAAILLGFAPHLLDYRLDEALKPGRDAFGRGLIALTLHASLWSSIFAAGCVAVSCAIGIAAGGWLALAPPRLRFGGLRLLELVLAFPSLLLALIWAAVRGPGWGTLFASLLIGTLPPLTRLSYARGRELLAQDYVAAARGLGAGPWQLATRHLAPALVELGTVKIPNLFAQALLAEATLSFLGIGAPIGRDTWGSLLAQGKDYLIEAPWIAVECGLPLVLTVLALERLSRKGV